MKCQHPLRFREPSRRGWVRCGRCGKNFRPAARHGSYAGYNRHQKIRGGYWPWPVLPESEGGCGCLEGAREMHRGYRQEPGFREKAHRRARAREAALIRLRRMYPADYAMLYAEELGSRGSRLVRQNLVPDWDGIVGRLVRAALDRTDDYGLRERKVMREVRQLRLALAARSGGELVMEESC